MKLALTAREQDIVTMLNLLWYRDFPITRERIDEKRVRAMYTAHLNGVVKACADMLGFFVMFEHGTRTDAIIKSASSAQKAVAKIEIEWKQPLRREKVNEIGKLSTAALDDEAESYIFIGYSDRKKQDQNLKALTDQWKPDQVPLIAILVVYDLKSDRRRLAELQTFIVTAGNSKKVRTQPALPWDVKDTRWAMGTDRAVVDAS